MTVKTKLKPGSKLETKKKVVPAGKPRIPMFISDSSIIDLNNLKAEDITIEHIAHSLSNLCRYNGSCSRFYSVAEHCARLAHYAQSINTTSPYHQTLAKALLLHDAAEAYIGDVIYHLKSQMPQFIQMEQEIEEIIFTKFGLTKELRQLVAAELKDLDRRISFDEMYALFGKIDPWFYENKIDPIGPAILTDATDKLGWTPEFAKIQFLIVANFFGLYEFPPEMAEKLFGKKEQPANA